jgi:Zn-dependent protease
MTWTWRLGKIAGIDLKVHWTFLILLVWIFWSYFSQSGEITAGLYGVVFILALFACVVLHELGHALAARRYGVNTRNIVLLPIGGVANLEKMPEKPREELIVALAGPAVNVVLATLLGFLLFSTGGLAPLSDLETLTRPTGRIFLTNLFAVNILLVVFNMIPAFPMDGGRVLRALLAMRYDRAAATNMAAKLGQLLAIGFVFLGFFTNFWLIFIGLFIYLGAGGENRMVEQQSLLAGYRVADATMHQYSPLQAEEPLQRAIQVLLDGQEKDFIVRQNGEPVGILTRDDIIHALKAHGENATIGQAARVVPVLQLSEDDDLAEAYQQLTTSNTPICAVRDRLGAWVGVLNVENIYELLLLRQAEYQG